MQRAVMSSPFRFDLVTYKIIVCQITCILRICRYFSPTGFTSKEIFSRQIGNFDIDLDQFRSPGHLKCFYIESTTGTWITRKTRFFSDSPSSKYFCIFYSNNHVQKISFLTFISWAEIFDARDWGKKREKRHGFVF